MSSRKTKKQINKESRASAKLAIASGGSGRNVLNRRRAQIGTSLSLQNLARGQVDRAQILERQADRVGAINNIQNVFRGNQSRNRIFAEEERIFAEEKQLAESAIENLQNLARGQVDRALILERQADRVGAITNIQNGFRGNQSRKAVMEKKQAVHNLQNVFRGNQSRVEVIKRQHEARETDRGSAFFSEEKQVESGREEKEAVNVRDLEDHIVGRQIATDIEEGFLNLPEAERNKSDVGKAIESIQQIGSEIISAEVNQHDASVQANLPLSGPDQQYATTGSNISPRLFEQAYLDSLQLERRRIAEDDVTEGDVKDFSLKVPSAKSVLDKISISRQISETQNIVGRTSGGRNQQFIALAGPGRSLVQQQILGRTIINERVRKLGGF